MSDKDPDGTYAEIIEQAISDHEGAFKAALASDDEVALATVAVLDPHCDQETASQRLQAFEHHHVGSPVASEMLLAVIEHDINVDLSSTVATLLHEDPSRFSASPEQSARIDTIVRDEDQADILRTRFLFWLWNVDRTRATAAATGLLEGPSESALRVVDRQAARVLTWANEEKGLELLVGFARLQFEPVSATDPPPRPRDPVAALAILDRVTAGGSLPDGFAEDILTQAATRAVDPNDYLDEFAQKVPTTRVASIMHHLKETGYAAWAAKYLVPKLIQSRPSFVASAAAKTWWPSECLAVIGAYPWHESSDRLYIMVLRELHKTSDSGARLAIRERVASHCENTNSKALKEMPRAGVRALLQLALAGEIPVDDGPLGTALAALDEESALSELCSANWKKPDRAARIASITQAVLPDLVPRMAGEAVKRGPDPASAFVGELDDDVVTPRATEIVDAVFDCQPALARLCEVSKGSADVVLERWVEGHSIAAFRALASSAHSEARLDEVSTAFRKYGALTTEQRRELLVAVGPTAGRLEWLLNVISDRFTAGPEKPTDKDVICALELLAEHLQADAKVNEVFDPIALVCRNTPQAAVRKAAYTALGSADPEESVVNLLLERLADESAGIKSSIRAALGQLADQLDEHAAEVTNPTRAQAASLLGRIDKSRAAVHARDVMTADSATDRMLAAGILADNAAKEDVAILQRALDEEPNAEARREFVRAIRRITIGDEAAAHERLCELADVENIDDWMHLDPKAFYGGWLKSLIEGLNRVASEEANDNYGGAIDNLDEIGKLLVFRAVEVAGDQISLGDKARKEVAENLTDYGTVLGWQQMLQRWNWVGFFRSLHDMRTAHIAPKGSKDPHPQPDESGWVTARKLFQLGSRDALEVIRGARSGS